VEQRREVMARRGAAGGGAALQLGGEHRLGRGCEMSACLATSEHERNCGVPFGQTLDCRGAIHWCLIGVCLRSNKDKKGRFAERRKSRIGAWIANQQCRDRVWPAATMLMTAISRFPRPQKDKSQSTRQALLTLHRVRRVVVPFRLQRNLTLHF
jgi:hypothetical protein